MRSASSRSTDRVRALALVVAVLTASPLASQPSLARADEAAVSEVGAETASSGTPSEAVVPSEAAVPSEAGVSSAEDVTQEGVSASEETASEETTSDETGSDDADEALRWLIDALRVVRPTLLGEVDYRVLPREEVGETGFALGRFRIGLVVQPLSWLRAVGTVEWVSEHPILLDAYVTVQPLPWLEIFVGYAKPPLFASFRTDPVHVMAFPDRAPVVRSFFVRRDVGVDLRARPREAPIEAVVRIGNGSGSILGNDNPLPAGYAALDLVLGRAWVGAAESDREHGLRLGVGGMIESVRDRDGVLGTEAFGYPFYRSAIVSGLRVVGEAHAVGYLGPVRLTLEGALAHEERSRDDDGNPNTPRRALEPILSSGLTAEIAWVIVGRARSPGAQPAGLAPIEAWDGGALEVAARFDALFLGRGASDVMGGGALGGGAVIKWWPLDFLSASLVGHVLRYDIAPFETPGELWGWDAALRLSLFWV